uniref:CD209 antigen-like protein C n=1 Tax=Doryrhamphus excisus TaxID=161450 RepID=UPI0025ADE094|nr:CD209 antigen-like protein C [Doryrhamphus excisus]
MTTMDTEDGNDERLFMDGTKRRRSVYALKNSPFRAATLYLVLLCVVPVTGHLGQSDHENLQATDATLSKSTDKLLASYNSTVEDKQELEKTLRNVTADRDLQRIVITNLTAEVEQLRAAITVLNATKVKTCPSNWKKFETSCYYSSSLAKKTWYLSRNYCQGNGADLVIINSKEEMEFVNGLFTNNKEVWMGLTDEGVEGQWKWVDGTSLTTAYWADSQPNSYNGNQDCAEFWHRSSGKAEWNDEKCSSHRYWVCEM